MINQLFILHFFFASKAFGSISGEASLKELFGGTLVERWN
jgi:hypothetical protein